MVKVGDRQQQKECDPWNVVGPRPSTSSMMIKLDPNLTTSEKLHYLKRGHTVSVASHSSQTCDKYHVRSSKVLANRGPSYPAQVPDINVETVNETHIRILMHENILKADAEAFKRKSGAESTSDYFHQKHLVRDYLYDMHPYYDPHDIGGTVYNRSILKIRAEQRCKSNNNEDDINNKEVMEDFLEAADPIRPRSTGYSRGHLRSIAKVDTFGPADSLQKTQQRELGLLPPPNIDRYKNMPGSAKQKLTMRSKTSHGSRGSSSASSLFADTNIPQSWNEQFIGNSNTDNKNDKNDKNDTYVKPHTTTGGSRQSHDKERGVGSFVPTNLMLDSNTKSLEWFKSYQKRLSDRELFKLSKQQNLKIQKENERLAKQLDNDLSMFEGSLKSKSMRV